MQPHEERVVQELKDLSEKLEKLTAFIDGEVYNSLPTLEQARLRRQFVVMQNYESILKERIDNFPRSMSA